MKICDLRLARISSESDLMTEYVVRRWYRAAELLLKSSEYSAAIDVRCVGCILMELMERKALFPGREHVHQLRLLMEGRGDNEFLKALGNVIVGRCQVEKVWNWHLPHYVVTLSPTGAECCNVVAHRQ
ncbi:hypothetical protein IFM89_039651 [Coptis chinensis]|uniref:Protein kinase domain-containing protein n=1 Tax=Coptis chinensis TaxID=261450 RepID=A0A835GU86_9MAGN|nr:hypothetical protein IFM89_039651 [Coptis chinensis]